MGMIPFEFEQDERPQLSAKRFALQVQAIAGSYLVDVTCDSIEEFISSNRLGFVYFGSKESVNEGGNMHHIHKVVQFDRHANRYEPMEYYINTEPDCKMKRGFTADEPAVALYVHS
jgi:hypothetical protein